jgi:hypothetical protein
VIDESTDEAVWEEFRGVEDEATLLRESLSPERAMLSSFPAIAGVGVTLVAPTEVLFRPEASGSVVLETVALGFLSGVDTRDGRDEEDALLVKTVWGFCLILVK